MQVSYLIIDAQIILDNIILGILLILEKKRMLQVVTEICIKKIRIYKL